MARAIETENRYTIDDLVREGFSRRTISYYVGRGLVPRAVGTGANAYYTDEHLKALRDIKHAKDTRRTLGDILDAAMIRRAARKGKR